MDMGVGHSFSARVGLRNRFSFCDNRWHTVKASYIKDSLALRVDNHREAYGFNGSGDHEGAITGAALFIGGLPGEGRLEKCIYENRVLKVSYCSVHWSEWSSGFQYIHIKH